MNFDATEDQISIRNAIEEICNDFGDDYWLRKDKEGGFPEDFYSAIAKAGWLGIAMPVEYGGSGLGIAEACAMMETVSASGAGLSGASSIHMNVFGLHPVVMHGSDEQKKRWLPPIIKGEAKACFGVTEPNTGLNTLKLKTMDLDRRKIEVREIEKLGRKCVDSNQLFIDGLEIPVEDRIGEEGRGFEYIMHGLNPERVLLAAEAIGLGRVALKRAARYAGERIVFDRPIGKNQGIQHPLAERWVDLEAGTLLYQRAAWLYDQGRSCGAEANAAKFFCAEAGYRACETAVLTHGGMGYAKEYHVERYFRESMLPRIAPISPQLILSFIAEKVLQLPKSY